MIRPPIEHDVPVPTFLEDFRYPWPQMRPGDSFVVRTHKKLESARASFYQYNKRQMKKGGDPLFIRTQSIGNNEWRIWVLTATQALEQNT